MSDERLEIEVVMDDARLRLNPGAEQRLNETVAWCVGPRRGSRKKAEPDAAIFRLTPDFLALARRVHAERGPRKGYMIGTTYWVCDGCGCEDCIRECIPHPPDCLWLAADALLRKAGTHNG